MFKRFLFALQIFFWGLAATQDYFDPVVVQSILKSSTGKVSEHYNCILMRLEKEFFGANLEHQDSLGLEKFVLSSLLELLGVGKTLANLHAIKKLLLVISSDSQKHTGFSCPYCLAATNNLLDSKDKILIYLKSSKFSSPWPTSTKIGLIAVGVVVVSFCCVSLFCQRPVLLPEQKPVDSSVPGASSAREPRASSFVSPPVVSSIVAGDVDLGGTLTEAEVLRLSELAAQLQSATLALTRLEASGPNNHDLLVRYSEIDEQFRKLKEEGRSIILLFREGWSRYASEVDSIKAKRASDRSLMQSRSSFDGELMGLFHAIIKEISSSSTGVFLIDKKDFFLAVVPKIEALVAQGSCDRLSETGLPMPVPAQSLAFKKEMSAIVKSIKAIFDGQDKMGSPEYLEKAEKLTAAIRSAAGQARLTMQEGLVSRLALERSYDESAKAANGLLQELWERLAPEVTRISKESERLMLLSQSILTGSQESSFIGLAQEITALDGQIREIREGLERVVATA